MTTRAAPSRPWTETWDPEDEGFWERGGKRIARRNRTVAVLAGHLALSVWGMWSALVLFRSPGTGPAYGPGGAFLLVAAPVAAGAAVRWAGRRAPGAVPGGRERIALGTAALLPPALAAAWLVQRPGTPLWALLIVAATAGAGGGTLSAAGARHLASLYPHRYRERVLAPVAGGGLSGVVAAQALGLLVIAAAGESSPVYVAVALLPPVALVAAGASLLMDGPVPSRALRIVPPVRPRAVAPRRARWAVPLRAGTSGALLGHCLAFGLVLRNEFGCSPRRAASYALLGAVLGWAARGLGGRAPDRRTAGRVVLAGTLGMAVTAALLTTARGTCGAFAAGFTALCVCGGLGAGALGRAVGGVGGGAGGGAGDGWGCGPRGVVGGGPSVYGRAGSGLQNTVEDGWRYGPRGIVGGGPRTYGRTGTGLPSTVEDGRRNGPRGILGSGPNTYGRAGSGLHSAVEDGRRNPRGIPGGGPNTYGRTRTDLPSVVEDDWRNPRGVLDGGPTMYGRIGTGPHSAVEDGRRNPRSGRRPPHVQPHPNQPARRRRRRPEEGPPRHSGQRPRHSRRVRRRRRAARLRRLLRGPLRRWFGGTRALGPRRRPRGVCGARPAVARRRGFRRRTARAVPPTGRTEADMSRVVLISGSLRRGSVNSAALRAVRRIVESAPGAPEVISLPIGRLPFYDGDVERSGAATAVQAARTLVADADALVISTPSYNGAVPGVLKNALDWLSRPDGASPLAGRVVAVLSASPSGRGAIDAQPALMDLLDACEAVVVEHPPVAIRRADRRLDAAGEMSDPEVLAALRGLVDATFEAVAILADQRRSALA